MSILFEYTSASLEEQQERPTQTVFDEIVRQCWDKAVSDGVFRYTLEDTKTRIVDGQYGFIVQNNPKRFTHRRTPHEMMSLTEPFRGDKFHFNKVKEKEILLKIKRITKQSNEEHLVVANVSPIEYGHLLLVPYPEHCLPQVITEESLKTCLELLNLSKRDDFCMVANSLLAYASVNHLHYHFLHLNYPLLATRLSGVPLNEGCHEIVGHPMKGFAFQVTDNVAITSKQVYHVIRLLLQQGIPHNLFALKRPSFHDCGDTKSLITVIVMPRKPAIGVKSFYDDEAQTVPPFFVAACEIGGFLPIIDQSKYPTITEQEIVQIMQEKSLTNDEFEHLKSLLVS